MDTNYEAFYTGLRELTNQEVLDEIYKKMREYCQLVEDEISPSTKLFKENLRILFDKVARVKPNNEFKY
jgi:hypothetical protein